MNLVVFYNSVLLKQFLNKFIYRGQKQRVELMFIKIITDLSNNTLIPGIFFFFEMFEQAKLQMKLVPMVKKKQQILVPIFLTSANRYFYGLQQISFNVKNLNYPGKLHQKLFYFILSCAADKLFYNSYKVAYYQRVLNSRQYKHFRW